MLDTLSHPMSMLGPTMLGVGEKYFKLKFLRRLENANSRLFFAIKVFVREPFYYYLKPNL